MSVGRNIAYALTNNVNNNNMCVGIFPHMLPSHILVKLDSLTITYAAMILNDIHSSVPNRKFDTMDAQSGNLIDVTSTMRPSDTTNTALTFAEGLPGIHTSFTPVKDDTFHMMDHPEIGMQDILSRPIRILTQDWVPGETINILTVSVLGSILQNPRVVNRINNMSYINGTVHVRVVVSGVPQHYGYAVAALDPWYDYNSTTTEISGNAGPTLNQLVQLPHIFIDPSTSTGGEISLPLMLPYNSLCLDDLPALTRSMGFHLMSFTSLQSLAASALPAHITIWAWMSDVVITNPTSVSLPYLEPQSGDEYGKPSVSKFASVVNQISSYMTSIPIIGPYARATEMISGKMAYLAELFGYSRPNSLRVEQPFQHKNVGNLVHYNFEDTCTKLTLDSKAEVTIDPTVVGANLTDEMAISSLVVREGYLGSFTWSDSNTISQPIARMCVTPCLTREITTTGILPHVSGVMDFTPVAFTALAFRKWRGTLKFRFVVACSAFHKGRLRIVFEPRKVLPITGTTEWNNESNINQSYILDLSVAKELIVKVPWASHQPYLDVLAPNPSTELYDFTNPQSIAMFNDRNKFNGLLGIHVLAPLVAPTDATSLRVMVFVSGCEDMEFQEPGNAMANYMWSGWAPQSGPELGAEVLTGTHLTVSAGPDEGEDIINTQYSSQNEKLAAIHYGERIVSIRQLLKRYSHHQHIKFFQAGGAQIYNFIVSDFPTYKGWNINAAYESDVGDRFNFARDSYMSYFTQAFLGYRGSIRQKYIISAPGSASIREAYVTRNPSDAPQNSDIRSNASFGTSLSQTANVINNGFDMRLGSVAVVPRLNNCIEVELPYYSPKRFHLGQWRNRFIEYNVDDEMLSNSYHRLTIMSSMTSADGALYASRMVAAGDDFQLLFFKYAPCGRNIGNPIPSTVL